MNKLTIDGSIKQTMNDFQKKLLNEQTNNR
jgi:hypothetical protein